ncbi:MAG TPA: DNA recombination protein RmuC [Longimicrobium sp.]|nr:DNA recombination protein RmuC [Longimicrobium sp.]
MTTQLLLGAMIALLLACLALLVMLLRRQTPADTGQIEARLAIVGEGQERAERAVRDEIARSREEAGSAGHQLRAEVGAGLKVINDTVFQNLGMLSTRQNEQLAQVMEALQQMTESSASGARQLREEVGATLERLRGTVEGRLDQIRHDNTEKLEQVRQTVDEKLHGVLEQRLGESFSRVSERLELVHRGLGEMQTLASGVGDLKKVLANVKVRGTWGEVQLGNLLRQVLTEDQFATEVMTNEHNGARVEYAIRLPGHDLGPVWLPIDAKFPLEDYQRLVDAQDAGDVPGIEAASRALEGRIRGCARDICLKYLNPPQTTDFALMFLPTEGLYAEVARRPGLVDAVQRESRVVIAGPITLWAILNSLQMGFRTLAIQQRSSEVWEVLGAVKTEFGKFGDVLAKVQKKLQSATNEMEQAGRRTRAIEKKLCDVQELPAPEAQRLLAVDGLVVSGAVDDEEMETDVAAD